MVDPGTMTAISLGSSVVGGLFGAKSASNNAEAQKLNIKGQMLQTMGQAFSMDVQAQQYEYASNIAKYQAGVARINRDIAKQNASYSRDVGEVEAQQSGMKARADRGEMLATQGASGLSVAGGSATRVRESMVDIGQYNQALIRSSAARKAYGYEVEATQNEAQAGIYDYTATMNEDQAANAKTAAGIVRQALPLEQQAMDLASSTGTTNMLGSLVGAAGSVADKWLKFNPTQAT